MKATGSEMLDYLRERLGGQSQLQEAISRERAKTRYKLTVMGAVAALYEKLKQQAPA